MLKKFIMFGAILLLLMMAVIPVFADYDFWGTKNTGMADCSFSLPLDASSMFFNPAMSGAFAEGVLSVGYGLPAAGFDAGNQLYIAYLRPLTWCVGYGVHGNFENLSGYRMFRLGADITKRYAIAGTLSFGGTAEWLQRSWDLPADDPLASRGAANNFSIGAGILWQPDEKFAMGLSALDILEPNLALESTEDKIPAKYALSSSYRISDYFTPEAGILYRTRIFGEQKQFEYRVGFIGELPSKTLNWRGGYNPQNISVGLGWHTDAIFGGLDVDYSLIIPTTSELRKAGATAHYIGLTIYGKPIRVRKGNIRMQRFSLSEKPKLREPVEVRAIIENTDKIPMNNFTVIFAYNDGSGFRMSYPSHFVDSLLPGEKIELSWRWRPRKATEYTLRAAADDDGSVLPQIHGEIPEKNEKDNLKIIEVKVEPTDTITIEPKFTNLSVSQVRVKVEEEPIVPVIFFSAGSDSIDEQGDNLLHILSRRLHENSNAKLILRGYYSNNENSGSAPTKDSLALLRANKVKNRMLSIEHDLKDRIVVDRDYNYGKPRIISKYNKNDARVEDENKRVEFNVISNVENNFNNYNSNVEKIMNNNPEFQLVIQSGTKNSVITDSIRNSILIKHPDWRERIILDNNISNSNNGTISLLICPDGVLYRPIERYPVSESFKNPEPAQNIIYIKRTGFDNTNSWTLSVIGEAGGFNKVIANGVGAPPDSVIWNWAISDDDEQKMFLAPNNEYSLRLKIEKQSGENIYFHSQHNISVRQRQHIEAIENMLLVEFVFDESEPLSKYLERRLFNFASIFVARADSGYKQNAEVQGHTDNIGTKKRNSELSTQRAKREYNIMRKYIAHFANIDENNLDNWLKSHNCSLSFKGYASQKPYELRGKLFGNNNSPYGRSINRRVTLEYEYGK